MAVRILLLVLGILALQISAIQVANITVSLRILRHPLLWEPFPITYPQPCKFEEPNENLKTANGLSTEWRLTELKDLGVLVTIYQHQIETYYSMFRLYNTSLRKVHGSWDDLTKNQLSVIRDVKNRFLSSLETTSIELSHDLTETPAGQSWPTTSSEWRTEMVVRVVKVQWSRNSDLVSPIRKASCKIGEDCRVSEHSMLFNRKERTQPGIHCPVVRGSTQHGVLLRSADPRIGGTHFYAHNGFKDYSFPNDPQAECITSTGDMLFLSNEGALVSFSGELKIDPMFLLRSNQSQSYMDWSKEVMSGISATIRGMEDVSSRKVKRGAGRSALVEEAGEQSENDLAIARLQADAFTGNAEAKTFDVVPESQVPKWLSDRITDLAVKTENQINLLANLTYHDIMADRRASCMIKYQTMFMAAALAKILPLPYIEMGLGHSGFKYQQDGALLYISEGRLLSSDNEVKLGVAWCDQMLEVTVNQEKCWLHPDSGLVECGFTPVCKSTTPGKQFYIPMKDGGAYDVSSKKTTALSFNLRSFVERFLYRETSALSELVDYSRPELTRLEDGSLSNDAVSREVSSVFDNFDNIVSRVHNSSSWVYWLKIVCIVFIFLVLLPYIPFNLVCHLVTAGYTRKQNDWV